MAQNARLGLRVGPTFGFLSDGTGPFTGAPPPTNTNPRLDLHAGVSLILPITASFSLQPELLYTRKGGHFSQPLSERYSVERYRLSYAQGMVLGRRAFSLPGRLSAHAVAGMSVDATLDGTVRRNAYAPDENFSDRINLMETDYLRRWDVGLVVGAGLEYTIGTAGRLALELRYNPGLRSVFSNTGGTPDSSQNEGIAAFPLARSLPTLRHDVVTASFSFTRPLTMPF